MVDALHFEAFMQAIHARLSSGCSDRLHFDAARHL
jgi:hypothetical protein